MKKLMSLSLATMLVLGLAACGGQAGGAPDPNQPENSTAPVSDQSAPSETPSTPAAPETITITSLNGNREPAELEVPYDPQRIAILDMASLDILDALGVGNRVVGSASTSLDYLQSYVTDANISNLGTIKEADLEAVMACEPDVIFIGGF